MSDWVADLGILKLRSQVNAAAPNRSVASDGTKGDEAHAARTSDHNPEDPAPAGNPPNQVDAIDLTHDPKSGADMAVVTESIRVSRDRRVKYVIFNRRILSSYASNGRKAWEWGPYDGSDPHTGHAHVSVNDAYHDETQPWKIGIDMADTAGAIAEQWRLYSLLMMDPKFARKSPEIIEGARMPTVPLITLLDRVDENVAAVREVLLSDPGPTEVVLSSEQLAALASDITRRVTDAVLARLGNLRIVERIVEVPE